MHLTTKNGKKIKTIRSCFHSTLYEFINRSPKCFYIRSTRSTTVYRNKFNQIQYNHKNITLN